MWIMPKEKTCGKYEGKGDGVMVFDGTFQTSHESHLEKKKQDIARQ